MPIRKILVATDFSPSARAALDLAVEIAQPKSASIILLGAYELPMYSLPDGSIINLDALAIQRIMRSVDDELQVELHRVADKHVDIRAKSDEGRPADVILRHAEREGVDLVVMGTHGRKGLRRLMLGSVAESVLRHATCPIVVAR